MLRLGRGRAGGGQVPRDLTWRSPRQAGGPAAGLQRQPRPLATLPLPPPRPRPLGLA